MESSRDDFVIAIRSAFLKKETKQRFSLLGLILFSVLFLFLGSFNFKIIDYTKAVIKEVVYRSSFIVSGPENFAKKNYLIISSHFKLYKENTENKSQLELLRSKDLSQKILNLENIRYKKLIDDYFIKENETFAKVLIDKQSPFLRSIILNKGSKNNIKLGMIVTDQGYLVGKVVEVNFFTSRVLLISDINSKIPVSLQPGDTQAIMSGKEKKSGILQYTKDSTNIDATKDILVLTSGAGGVFKSGIPVGKIIKKNNIPGEDKVVDFYRDFSQLKYVKVVSFLKESKSLDETSKKDSSQFNKTVVENNQQKAALKILLEQKKIAEDIRITIQEDNNILRNKIIRLENELLESEKEIKEMKISSDEIKYLELNPLYEKKCKKTMFNTNLYKVGSPQYKACILSKGKI